MRFLIYGINYFPELTGIGKYTGEMCEWLAKQGHDVTVITSNPYYPEWKIHNGYRNWFSREMVSGVEVLRCPLYVPGRVTGKTRILQEISFIFSSFFYWFRMLFRRRYDVVICISPPFHTCAFGIMYAKVKGGHLLCHIQDLQVDAAEKLQRLKNRRFLKVLINLERFLLKSVDTVSTISEGMLAKIV